MHGPKGTAENSRCSPTRTQNPGLRHFRAPAKAERVFVFIFVGFSLGFAFFFVFAVSWLHFGGIPENQQLPRPSGAGTSSAGSAQLGIPFPKRGLGGSQVIKAQHFPPGIPTWTQQPPKMGILAPTDPPGHNRAPCGILNPWIFPTCECHRWGKLNFF